MSEKKKEKKQDVNSLKQKFPAWPYKLAENVDSNEWINLQEYVFIFEEVGLSNI